MGPFPRDAHHPPHTHGELGTKLQAWATSKVPCTCPPSHPAPCSKDREQMQKPTGLRQRSAVQVLPQQSQ